MRDAPCDARRAVCMASGHTRSRVFGLRSANAITTSGDDDALPPLEELSGADASPGNGAGARGYDFAREDRRRGVRGARHDEVPVLRVYIDNPRRTADTILFMRDACSTPNGVQP